MAFGNLATRPPKVQITLRLDQEVARWFWQQGQGYESRINAVLRASVWRSGRDAV